MQKNEKGFTLIELVMVIVILGILAAVAVPKYYDLSDEALASACSGAKGAIMSGAAIMITMPATEDVKTAGRGTAATREEVIDYTPAEGFSAAANGSTAGKIDITLASDATYTCALTAMNTKGLTSD